MEINIPKFDPSVLQQKGNNIMITGRKASGISTLIVDLLKQYKDKLIVIMSETEESNDFYKNNIGTNNKLIYSFYSTYVINTLIDHNFSFVLVIDGYFDGTAFKRKEFEHIIYNGHLKNISLIYVTPYHTLIPCSIRANTDYTFILRQVYTKNNYNNLYQTYTNGTTKDIFNQVLDTCTNDYNCMVYNKGTLLWYKAQYKEKKEEPGPIIKTIIKMSDTNFSEFPTEKLISAHKKNSEENKEYERIRKLKESVRKVLKEAHEYAENNEKCDITIRVGTGNVNEKKSFCITYSDNCQFKTRDELCNVIKVILGYEYVVFSIKTVNMYDSNTIYTTGLFFSNDKDVCTENFSVVCIPAVLVDVIKLYDDVIKKGDKNYQKY